MFLYSLLGLVVGLCHDFHVGPSLVSAIQLEANHTNNQIPSNPEEGSLTSTSSSTTTKTTTAATTSVVQQVTFRSSENTSEDDLGLFPDLTTDEDDTLLSSKPDLVSDVSKLVPFEDLDEENDAKLFWDVVNSIQQWQEHKVSISSTFYARVFRTKFWHQKLQSYVLGLKFFATKILYKKHAGKTLMKLTAGKT